MDLFRKEALQRRKEGDLDVALNDRPPAWSSILPVVALCVLLLAILGWMANQPRHESGQKPETNEVEE